MMKKIKSEKGFTLAELLIVVAIIAVLVAIAIPIFTKQIEKSREAVDLTSMRNAYALASVAAITEDKVDGIEFKNFTGSNPAYYDGGGSLTTSKPSPYGKGKRVDAETTYHACSDYGYDAAADYTGSVVMVWYDGTEVHVHWENVGSGNVPDHDTPGGNETEAPGGNNDNPPANVTDNIPTTDYPDQIGNFTAVKGNVYKYDGQLYVYVKDDPNLYVDGDPANSSPAGSWYVNRFVPLNPDATVYTSADLGEDNKLRDVERGSLYREGNDLYIMETPTGQAIYQLPPSLNQNWIRINM